MPTKHILTGLSYKKLDAGDYAFSVATLTLEGDADLSFYLDYNSKTKSYSFTNNQNSDIPTKITINSSDLDDISGERLLAVDTAYDFLFSDLDLGNSNLLVIRDPSNDTTSIFTLRGDALPTNKTTLAAYIDDLEIMLSSNPELYAPGYPKYETSEIQNIKSEFLEPDVDYTDLSGIETTLLGTDLKNFIVADAGGANIIGLKGNDFLIGNTGNDYIFWGGWERLTQGRSGE